jgi:hypothetical protein
MDEWVVYRCPGQIYAAGPKPSRIAQVLPSQVDLKVNPAADTADGFSSAKPKKGMANDIQSAPIEKPASPHGHFRGCVVRGRIP